MRFTVLIPAYKCAYLREAIGSVVAQTCPDRELVVVNDTSVEDPLDFFHLENNNPGDFR